ncbi:SpoIIE family protein phosphatase [Blastococcus deserti]|uniref:SpoIIE family protein phosphatase n=1 Tax=Blastococcus deserti TaxID=2259033 RepID=A0ABW4X630_9ACTN
MRRLSLSTRELDAFGSSGVSVSRTAHVEEPVDGFAVDVTRYAPGAVNGRHPTGLWQLLAVVSGSGWASGADDVRIPLAAGEAVLWEPGEEHASGSDDGMVAVVVQSPVPLPEPSSPPRGADEGAQGSAGDRLSRTLERYEWVLANVADGIYGLDADGRVEFVNPAAVRITGHAADEQRGQDQHALLHGRRPDGSHYPKQDCPVWRSLRTGRTVVAEDELFWHRDGTGIPIDLIAVPTVEDGTVTGVIVSFRDLTDRRAAQRQAAELRRLSEEAAEQRALSDRLQQALLTPPPEPDHLHVAVRYAAAAHEAQVGGDWYDAFLQPDGATMLVIGDVVGHGSDAAAAMGQLRGVLRALAYDNDEGPAATLSRLERTAQGLAVGTLATGILARIERRPDVPVAGVRVLRWSNAGHLPPVLLAPDGTSRLLTTRPDLMLGVTPDARRADHTADLPDGSTLLLFTDGLVERHGADLDEGLAALQKALLDLGEAPLEELCDAVLRRLVPGGTTDDVALVAVRAYPEDRPRPAEAGPNILPPSVD